MKRALAALALSALCCGSVAAAERTVAVVVDRSASLRYADPEGRGPRLLALALALALQSGERVIVFPTGAAPGAPGTVSEEPASLEPLVRGFLSTTPQPGGADLTATLDAAAEAAGPTGLIIIYTDDDLDVVDREGTVPPRIMRRALEKDPRPTRTDVNQAASELMTERLRATKTRVLALRALLPAGGRSTPFLEGLGAQTVDLVPSAYEVVRRLAEHVRGEPIVSHAAPAKGSLELPYSARVALLAEAGTQVAGAASLDGAARLWLADVSGPVRVEGEALALISPRMQVPGKITAYGLRNGEVRVGALESGLQAGGSDTLVVTHGGKRAAFEASPPGAAALHATLALSADALPDHVTVLRVIREGRNEAVVAARRSVAVETAEVELLPVKGAQADRELELVGRPSPGLMLEELAIEVRESGGAMHQVDMVAGRDGLLRVTVIPRSDGPLGIRSQGPVDLKVGQEINVAEAEAQRLRITSLRRPNGEDLGGPTALVLDRDNTGAFELELHIQPKPPRPLAVALLLSNAPAGTRLEPPGPHTVGEQQTIALTLHWPAGADGTAIGVRAEAENALPDTRTLPVEPGAGPMRYVAAGVLLCVALVWGFFMYRRWTRVDRFLEKVIKEKQLRVVGRNGRLSPELYRFSDFLDEENLTVLVMPEESPGGALAFSVRGDGTVVCEGRDGAQIVHADRPTILAESTVLTHGTPFAMVYKNRALRYVYLERDANADELSTAYLADAMTHDEASMRDSGVFLILDDEAPNVPRYSARLEASTEMLTVSQEIVDSSSEVAVMPPSDAGAPLVSDEGVIYMDSAEGEIMDSAEITYLEDSADDEPYSINMDELYGDED